MDGIKGNEIILDTLLSSDDMANYEKNHNEMSKMRKLPISSTRFYVSISNNSSYQLQTQLSSGNDTRKTYNDESLYLDNGIIKFNGNVFSGIYVLINFNVQVTTLTTQNDVLKVRMRYYINDDYETPYDYGNTYQQFPISNLTNYQYVGFTYGFLLTPGSEITGFSIELCNSGTNGFTSGNKQSTITLIGFENHA